MAWYYGTYSCGHEGRVNVVGPGKDRKWKIENEFSGLCPECYKKHLAEEREKENEEAKRISEEMELPELSGTPKQVAWANTLRIKAIEKISFLIDKFRNSKKQQRAGIKIGEERIKLSENDLVEIEEILLTKSDARFWIDRRMDNAEAYIKEAYRTLMKKNNAVPEEVKEEIEQGKEYNTVEPQNKIHEGIVNIDVYNGCINVKYVKNEDFIAIVKSLNYFWDGVWKKKITEYTGSAENLSAQLGNKLLGNGFTVCFPESDSRDMAISGNFIPECTKWIKYNVKKDMLAITWVGYSDNIYKAAKKLSGARWYHSAMLVPVEFNAEILDFADIMGFSVSKRAAEEIKSFQERSNKFLKKNVKEAVFEEKNGDEELRRQLEKSGIIEDLKDEA